MAGERSFTGLPALVDVDIKIKTEEDNEPTPFRVLVRNLPADSTETRMKELFSQAGPVTLFTISASSAGGEMKGFCHYRDLESAQNAVKMFDRYEIGFDGSVKLSVELMEAGENNGEISKAVASLPPEQMFELMKQMKLCIQNNPQEARTMLNQNPQLAYALLQAQVIMRIVDSESALDLLNHSSTKSQHYNYSNQNYPAPVPAPSVQHPSPSTSSFNRYGNNGGTGQYRDPRAVRETAREHRDPRESRSDPRESRVDTRDPRDYRDPRGSRDSHPHHHHHHHHHNHQQQQQQHSSSSILPAHLANADPEKAQLIMQVLQLTDEQIAMLPADQRMSIMELKKQINP